MTQSDPHARTRDLADLRARGLAFAKQQAWRDAAAAWSEAHALDPQDGGLLFDLAMVWRLAGQPEAALRALTQRPADAPPLSPDCELLRGEILEQLTPDSPEAHRASFQAIRRAQQRGQWTSEGSTPPGMRAMVSGAMRRLHATRLKHFPPALDAARAAHGSDALKRVDHALAAYLGQLRDGPRDPRQAPKFFYMPGLTDQPYHDPMSQPWAGALLAAYADIRAEALALMREDGLFESFLSYGATTDRSQYVGGDGPAPAWDAYFFYRHGQRHGANHARCPKTSAALEAIERCEIAGQAPEICFSLLAPGSHIKPHHGVTNTRLVMHLPLLVPPDCALNLIDAGAHAWREGELMMFDDTYQHEAWNRSSEPRLILLMDCWNPELTPPEKAAIKALVECISEFENAF